jgi:hypothetical protein
MSENQEKPSLSHTQNRALAALVRQPTIPLAAAEAGVTDRTIYRWLAKDEAFKAEYLQLRREVVNNAVFQLQKATNNAVNCLLSVINDPEASSGARVRAATTVLEFSLRVLEAEDLDERIARLEQASAEQAVRANGHNRRGVYSY